MKQVEEHEGGFFVKDEKGRYDTTQSFGPRRYEDRATAERVIESKPQK